MGLYYMNKEQKQFKLLIKSDLRIVERNWDSDDKADRLQAAYHMQQAIEKTIKLKAYVHGIDDIWGHDIRALINWCKKKDSFHLIHSSDVSRKEDSHETDNELSNRAE